ncbi:ATP-binding protein [Dyella sp. 20L07]|uniref:ATP-binding protein n=1 Tax=Dyella sp. 20L07 TaxID=3384240 RepID=UPI003D2A5B2C
MAERDWVTKHPVIHVGVYTGDHLPLETWQDDRPQGIGPEYIQLLAAKAGLKVVFEPFSDWAGVTAPEAQIPYDALVAQKFSPNRQASFLPLKPYAYERVVAVTRKDDPNIRSERDLTSARLIVERRYKFTEQEIRDEFPSATLMFSDDGGQALDMVAHGQADAYIGSYLARTRELLRHGGNGSLAILTQLSMPSYGMGPVIRRDKPELFAVMQKAENMVTTDELTKLRSRWGYQGNLQAVAPIISDDTHPPAQANAPVVLRMGFEVHRKPYTFVNEQGEFDGLAADYIHTLRDVLGIQVKPVPADSWQELNDMVMHGQIDLVAATMVGDFNADEMLFSRPYEQFPLIIVGREDSPPIAALEDLAGRTISVRDEPAVTGLLQRQLHDTKLIPVTSKEAGLAQLSQQHVDAYIGTLPAIDELLRGRYAGKLRILGPAGFDQALSFGISPKFAYLLPQINRALASVGERDKQATRARWLTAEYKHYTYGVDWYWVLGILLISGLIVMVPTVAYFRLRRETRARQEAEARLADQLNVQRTLLKTVPYPVFVKDNDSRYVEVNSAYEETYNVRAQDIIGKTADETRHLPVDDVPQFQALEAEMRRYGSVSRREIRNTDSEHGTERHALVWLEAFVDNKGKPAGMLGTVVDVTDFRIAEAQAQASTARLSSITDALPAAVFQFRMDVKGSKAFTYAAGDTLGTVGLTPEQMMADEVAVAERVHPDDRPAIMANTQLAFTQLTPFPQMDVRHYTQQGLRWIRTAGSAPVELPDGSVEWSGYFVDVHDTYEQAAALAEAKREAEAASAARGAFLAMMSHEIRTPMAGVISLGELLAKTNLDHEQEQMLQMINSSAGALLQILDDILDFSRIEAGRLQLEHAPFGLRPLLDDVLGLFAAKIWEKELKLYMIVDWRIANTFIGDSVRVRQIVSNLLGNAVKFTHSGQIILRASLAHATADTQTIDIAITDTGIGIAPDTLTKLFQPFKQAESSTTRRFGGTGLGLTICKHLAKQMGGDVWLESEMDQGTTAHAKITWTIDRSATNTAPEFSGHVVVLATEDGHVKQEAFNALASLGFNVLEDQVAELPTYTLEDAQLLVMDAKDAVGLPNGIPTILLDHAPSYSGYHVTDGQTRLSTNPLLIRATVGACRSALGLVTPRDVAELPKARSARILVAEDNAVNRAVVSQQLQRLGYTGVLVENGKQAIAELAMHRYDLLLTDCHMPFMDGFELARYLRESTNPALRNMPIIGVSASALPEEVERCHNAGMNDFMAKPMRLDTLEKALARHLPTQSVDASDMPPDTPAIHHADLVNDERLAVLIEAYGDLSSVKKLLQQLLAVTESDMAALRVATDEGDEPRARDLLHGMEGSLAFLKTGASKEATGDREARSIALRTQHVKENVVSLRELLTQFDNAAI